MLPPARTQTQRRHVSREGAGSQRGTAAMEVDTPAGREEDGQPPSHPSTLISTEQLNPADLLPWVEAGRVSRNYHLQLPKVVPWIKKNSKVNVFV